MNVKIVTLWLLTSLSMVGCGGGSGDSATATGTGGSGSSLTKTGKFYYSIFNYTDSSKKYLISENEKWADFIREIWGNNLGKGDSVQTALPADANPQKPSKLEGMIDFEMLDAQNNPIDHKNGFIAELGPKHLYAYFMTKTITQGTQLPASFEQVDVFSYSKEDLKGKVPVINYLRDGDITLNRQCTDSSLSRVINEYDFKRGDRFSFSCPEALNFLAAQSPTE
ncbi:hypothetical protein CS022_20845 [Veronia nyctiphanis]|uniref:Lipoprotein n=1 Tax=Veronia nyctiphanis TaxID=1278244 RepID=A0A4Q0YMC4_9GAMM|nr:hypothetical protein [Veronia nyctiphanis]RXJ71535.1 hypothetical protein CS022_20845 [Veronia nyctiphanis]